ncbi:uncharacterized protein IL334_004564 [Kwoniella shivajii]|uniref:Uncharacterized protein n=1 Tax=Kwoniella shivajii TaxID=564305 RepID=A0ABZ1D1X8_9TREE|nr:hypothetical protein IL334_004564 [Kwoniella shivajii]
MPSTDIDSTNKIVRNYRRPSISRTSSGFHQAPLLKRRASLALLDHFRPLEESFTGTATAKSNNKDWFTDPSFVNTDHDTTLLADTQFDFEPTARDGPTKSANSTITLPKGCSWIAGGPGFHMPKGTNMTQIEGYDVDAHYDVRPSDLKNPRIVHSTDTTRLGEESVVE